MNNHHKAIKATYFSIASSIALTLIKGLAGIFGNSYALVADAIESLNDVFASLLVLLGLRYAARPADENHPYGHGKIEPLITFAVTAMMVASATLIAYESIRNIGRPHESPAPWTLGVLVAIIGWKEWSYRVVMRKSKETGSSALKADAWHHRSDAITSVMAFLGISVALVLGPGYEKADDWAALLASGFILYNAYLILRPALGEIMDEQVYEELIEEIRRKSLLVDGILDTEKCFVRKAGMLHHVDLHAIVDGRISVKGGHDLAHALQDHLREAIPGLGKVLIHVEPG